MASSSDPDNTGNDDFFKNVINPYLAEVKMHPQVLQLKDGVLHKQDLQGPKEGDVKTRLEEVEQEVFEYKKMIERGVSVNHRIIAELTDLHKQETEELREKIFLLENETVNLQAQIYDLHNQMCEYELRFKRISSATSFRSEETRSSFVDGKHLPWKFGAK